MGQVKVYKYRDDSDDTILLADGMTFLLLLVNSVECGKKTHKHTEASYDT